MPLISGRSAALSWVFAALTATASGSPAASERTWIFEPALPRSAGFGPVSGPPFLARTLAASMIAHDQSTSPAAPWASSTARCSFGHSPAPVQSWNRRCAVGTETPNEGGRCRHAHPVVSTYTIAVNTARSGTAATPPPCGLVANKAGSNGWVSAHSSSGTSRRERTSSTHHILRTM